MFRIPFNVSQVAQVTVAAIDASRTKSTGAGAGNYNFGGVVLSQSGEPFKLHRINSDNIEAQLGEPLHPRQGLAAMSLRYAKEAVRGGEGYVVPVVGADAMRPIIGVEAPAVEGDPVVATARVTPYTGDVSLEAGELMALYPVDGDVTNRTISITPIADKEGFYNLLLVKNHTNGAQETKLDVEVSFDIEALDDYGNPAYIEDVLDDDTPIRVVVSDTFAATSFSNLAAVNFTGGTRGDLNALQATDFDTAISVLRNAMVEYLAVLPLGVLDPVVIRKLQDIALERRIDGFFDVPPTLSYADAISWMNDNAFDAQSSCFYHFPYKTNDLYFSKNKAIWGISSIGYLAKCKSVASVSGAVGGFHISPAGSERGVIERSGIEPLANMGEPNYEAMVTARINKVSLHRGTLIIDDALTATKVNNYLRFQHVTSLFNAISRRFYKAAMDVKHSPDDVTMDNLNSLMRDIGAQYIGAKALVTPRDPERDGTEPFKWTIKQIELDLFKVEWWACPTGSSRRIAGSPIVIR
ncbi:hypothetical protein [Pseudoalteromonas ruthenica]|uniref:hypothetical protein n=1 Tax=Pseudoalteromonas ruthenica TaxID=151081 RepID=UPI00110AED74|nr:hypothetical protein [Pseudoalteromonas ruthenica]TMO87708.1 hypothetical protein CWC12_10545 [Pseudoalteromonas ruthenica]TMP21513.1 hypothetical protein CWC06_18370 [Pseudoalteromonas ruthenica]